MSTDDKNERKERTMNWKKAMRTAAATACAAAVFTAGVYAAPVIEKVQAERDAGVTVKLDGVTQTLKDGKGNTVVPLKYQGTVYLPVRAVSGLAGFDVKWDGTSKTVLLTSKAAVKPDTGKPDVTKPDQPPVSTDQTIAALDKRADALVKEVNELKPATTQAEKQNQFRTLKGKIKTLDQDIDRYEDQLKADYRSGKLTHDQYKALDNQLDRTDDKISDLDDVLENLLGIDD